MVAAQSGEPSLTTLRVLAVLGSPASLDELAALLGADLDATTALLTDSESVVISDDGAYAQMTAEDQASVLDGISPSLRAAVEGQVGTFLAKRDAAPRRVAEHFAHAGRSAATDASRWLRKAGNELVMAEPVAAADLLGRASATAPLPSRDELLDELLDPLLWLGRADEAAATARDLLTRHADGSDRSVVLEVALRLATLSPLEDDGISDDAATLTAASRPARRSLMMIRRYLRGLLDGTEPEPFAVDEPVGDSARSIAEGFALIHTDADAAREHFRTAAEIARTTGVAALDAVCELGLAATAYLSGDASDVSLFEQPALRAVVAPERAHALVEAGDFDGAERIVAGLEGLPTIAASTAGAAALLHCRGLVTRDATVVEAAEAGYAQASWAAPRAAALAHAVLLYAATGDEDHARRCAKTAIEAFTAIGADAEVHLLRQQLRGFGIRVGAAAADDADGALDLTAAEARVAQLVAQGLSNRDVAEQLAISRYTVDAHLRRIFSKAGVSSRAELAAKLADRA